MNVIYNPSRNRIADTNIKIFERLLLLAVIVSSTLGFSCIISSFLLTSPPFTIGISYSTSFNAGVYIDLGDDSSSVDDYIVFVSGAFSFNYISSLTNSSPKYEAGVGIGAGF